MKFQTMKFALLAAMCLLLLAGVVSLISGSPDQGAVTPTSDSVAVTPDSATPAVSNAPVTPLLTITPKPVTPTPNTVQTTPTAAPTAAPTPTPVPTPAVRDLGSGSFRSETGVPINLACIWTAKTSGQGTAEITVTTALESYALYINASADALKYTVNGKSVAVDMPAINTDTTEPIVTQLGSMTFTVNLADGETMTVPISVDWSFGGTYSDVSLPVVTASTSATLSR